MAYLTLSLALLFAAPLFAGGGVERSIRWLFVAGFVRAVAAFIGFWLVGGDLVAFEVAILSVDWIVLMASGRCRASCSDAPAALARERS